MKRLLAGVSLVAVTTTAALAAPAPAAKPTAKPALAHQRVPIKVAPADEYFGKLKMSVLGIRNTIKDVGANIEIDQTRWAQQASKALFAEDATRDWERKYPKDTWLAKTVFALERMYAKLDTDEGRKRSLATMHWLVHDFPTTWYGKTGKRELAQGKVGRPVVTAAQPSSGDNQIAAPAVLSSSAPGFGGQTSTSSYSTDQASGGAAPTSPPNPLPSASPAADSH